MIEAAAVEQSVPWRRVRCQTPREEFANTLTHGFGFVAAAVAAPMVVASASRTGDAWFVSGCVACAATTLMVFAASTLSHAYCEPARKRRWEAFDQAAIFLMIAGSFSPYAAAYLREGWWPLLTVLVWAMAILGCVAKLVPGMFPAKMGLWPYLVLGWLTATSIPYFFAMAPSDVVFWTILGGLSYTVGTLFLRFDHLAPFTHVLWHLAVLVGAGSTCWAVVRIGASLATQ